MNQHYYFSMGALQRSMYDAQQAAIHRTSELMKIQMTKIYAQESIKTTDIKNETETTENK